jgi:BirA family biotin operon repressor/biotin-[acetyl-CoA-carboxylase] ligase
VNRPQPFEWASSWARTHGLRFWSADETESTNSTAKNDDSNQTRPGLANPPAIVGHPSLYIARAQTSGRGRGGNTWKTPEGALLASWAFALPKVPQPIFSPLVGLALFEAAHTVWPSVSFNLKAPNDLYIGMKKTAGLLIEIVDRGDEKRCVIGLGFNVSQSPHEIETSTHLAEHAGNRLDEGSFHEFLNQWQTKLIEALASGLSEELNSDARLRLKNALNLHPLLNEPVLEVGEKGQLRSAGKTLNWQDL